MNRPSMHDMHIDNVSANCDFDRATSCWSYASLDGWERLDHSSHSFLRGHDGAELQLSKIYNKYRPIELFNISREQRDIAMLDWAMEVYEVYYKYLDHELLEQFLDDHAERIKIRPGVKKFLEFLIRNWAPVLIYSAGITNVIHRVLEKNGLANCWIHVHWNNLEFDRSGKIIIPDREKVIYAGNKTWENVPSNIRYDFRERANMLVVWDNISYIQMWDPSKELYNIGFYLQGNMDRLRFMKAFDQVVLSDEDDNG